MPKRGRIFFGFSTLLLLLLPVIGQTTPQSQSLVQQGYQHLTKRNFERALKSFEAATKADPADGQALFFQGVALNRLGRFGEAGENLDGAAKLATHPDWAFERGWAHLGQSEWKEAVRRLKAYQRANPDHGQADEFLGRAYVGLNQTGRAKKHLAAAADKNPNLKPSVEKTLAALDALRRAESPKPREEKKRWGIRSNAGGIYNTNAINLGNGATLPTNIARQDSTFSSGALGAGIWFPIGEKSRLNFGHQFLGNAHEVSNRLNVLDNQTFIQFRHPFTQKTVLGMGVTNHFTVVRTAKFREQIGFRPVLGWRLTDWLVSELLYNFNYGEYFFASNANQNRDGHAHTAGLNGYFSVPNTKWKFRLGYNHLWNRSDGADFDYQGNAFSFAVSRPLFWEVTGEVFFSQGWNRYDNVNSLTASTTRSDDVSNVFVRINYPIHGVLSGYFQAGYMRNKSNINTFNYRSQNGGAGFTVGI